MKPAVWLRKLPMSMPLPMLLPLPAACTLSLPILFSSSTLAVISSPVFERRNSKPGRLTDDDDEDDDDDDADEGELQAVPVPVPVAGTENRPSNGDSV
jgi:hypothetical protein